MAGKGYGFITADHNQKQYFVHFKELKVAEGGYRSLVSGQKVEFEAEELGTKLKALSVTAPNGGLLESGPKPVPKQPTPSPGGPAAAVADSTSQQEGGVGETRQGDGNAQPPSYPSHPANGREQQQQAPYGGRGQYGGQRQYNDNQHSGNYDEGMGSPRGRGGYRGRGGQNWQEQQQQQYWNEGSGRDDGSQQQYRQQGGRGGYQQRQGRGRW